jgi:plastocyanin
MSRRSLSVLAVAAVLSLAACSGGGAATIAPAGSAAGSPIASSGGGGVCAVSTSPGTVQASMEGIAFVPATIQAKVGDVIAWTNKDSASHTATFKDDPACTTPNLAQGATAALTFSAAGTYPFICKIHSDMHGTIEVTS